MSDPTHDDRPGDCPPLPDDFDPEAGTGVCYSAKNCEGKVLNRETSAAACKKSGGKSWLSDASKQCYNL